MHRRHASPALRERSSQMSTNSQTSVSSTLPGYGTSAIVAMDRKASVTSGPSFSSGLFSSQASVGRSTERSLESVLNASKQKVTAIESMLRGLDISEKGRSVSLDLGIFSSTFCTFLCYCIIFLSIILPETGSIFCEQLNFSFLLSLVQELTRHRLVIRHFLLLSLPRPVSLVLYL